MTKVQIYQTQNAENRIYFLGSLIGSCVVGIPLGFFLCNEIAEIPGLSYISYQFPWLFLLLYFVLRPRSGTRFPPGRWKTGARRSCSVLSSGRFPSISPLPFALGLSKSSAMYCLISTKSCRASSEMWNLFIQCAYLFCEGDVLEKNGSAGSVKFFSHFGLQTLACMKSTCNGPSPMTASRRFVFIGFLLPHWVPAAWRSRAQTST